MEKKEKYTSGFLFATPSFLMGAGTVFNLAGNYYEFNTAQSGADADRLAIENDFRMVGLDIYDSVEALAEDV